MTDDLTRRNRRSARKDPRAEPEGAATTPEADVVDTSQLPPSPVFTTTTTPPTGQRRVESPTLPATPSALTGPAPSSTAPTIVPRHAAPTVTMAATSPQRSLTLPAIPSMRGALQLEISVSAPPTIMPVMQGPGAQVPTLEGPHRRETLDERRMREAVNPRADGSTEPTRRPTQARMKALTGERDALAEQVQELERAHLAERDALAQRLAHAEARVAELEGEGAQHEKRAPEPRALALLELARQLGVEFAERTAKMAAFAIGLEAAALTAQRSLENLRSLREQAQTNVTELHALGKKLEATVTELHGLSVDEQPTAAWGASTATMPNHPSIELSIEPGEVDFSPPGPDEPRS